MAVDKVVVSWNGVENLMFWLSQIVLSSVYSAIDNKCNKTPFKVQKGKKATMKVRYLDNVVNFQCDNNSSS